MFSSQRKSKVENEKEKIGIENKNEKKGLALSNSQSSVPNLSFFVKISIDRLTIVGDFPTEIFERLSRQWLTFSFIRTSGAGFEVLDYSNCRVDDFGNPHDEVPPEQVAYFEVPRFQKDKIRIDFNPNHSMETPAGQWLLKEVIAKIQNKHYSRCDIAFDIYNDSEIQYYQVWRWGMTKKFFYGKNGELQTVYFGARSSERQIRLYNKKIEQEQRHGRIVNVDSLWRLEMQLRGSKIENYVQEVKEMLEEFYLPDWESGENINHKMIIYALTHEPNFYGQLSQRTKQRYKKLIRDAKKSNRISEILAHEFVKQFDMLEGTLQEMMQRYHARNVEVQEIAHEKPSAEYSKELISRVRKYWQLGKSIREIASTLGILVENVEEILELKNRNFDN